MNTIHASIFASFIPAAFSNSAEIEGIENVIEAIHSEWRKVTELAASAKKALFAVKSHLGTFETALHQKETTRRRAVLDKQSALVCNYAAADYAFRFFGQRLVKHTRVLATLIPELVEDCGRHTGDSGINDARRSNTVLCARIISDMPETLKALHAQFAVENVMDIASGSGAMTDLSLSLFDHTKVERFAAPLNLPYHFGVISDAAYKDLEEKLHKLAATLEKAEQVTQAFERARSLAHNQEQFQSRLASVSTAEQARLIVKEADDSLINYRAASVALEKATSEAYLTSLACQQQLKAAPSTYGDTDSGLWAMVQCNRVAAKCLVVSAMARLSKMKGQIHSKDNHELRGTSYATLETAFNAIPVTFQFPHLHFLQCR